MAQRIIAGQDLPEAVARHVLDLAPGGGHEHVLLKRHVDAICRWLEKCFPGDSPARLRRAG
jgi:hypothetical protein